jgi:superfamily II DNA or RNA helicase
MDLLQHWHAPETPRPWQEDAFARWNDQGQRGIAQVVTGGGKTRLAEMCIFEVMLTEAAGSTIVVVPTMALLDQWYVDLQEEMGIRASEISVYGGGSKASALGKVNLVILNTARAVAPVISAAGRSFLVVDECHRAATPINSRALAGEHAATLGLSATPVREYDRGFEEILVPSLGEIFYNYGYDEARREGVITPFSLVNVEIPLTDGEQKEYEGLSRKVASAARGAENGTVDPERLKRLLRQRAAVSNGAKMRVPVCVNLADRYRGLRMVIFHERIDAAEEIVALLRSRGHNATIYHSKISGPVRRDNLRLFRRGVFQVLVSCRALDEGMNVPEAEVGIIASSTASARQRIQRLGRVLRPAEKKSRATVITLYATDVEQKRLRAEADGMDAASDIQWMRAEVPSA